MFTIRGKLTARSAVVQIQPICYVTSAIFANDVTSVYADFLLTPFCPYPQKLIHCFAMNELKMNTSTRKSTLTLVTLPSFSISGEILAEKMYVENCKIYRRLYDWGHHTPSHTNVCKFCNFQHTFSRLIFHLKC